MKTVNHISYVCRKGLPFDSPTQAIRHTIPITTINTKLYTLYVRCYSYYANISTHEKVIYANEPVFHARYYHLQYKHPQPSQHTVIRLIYTIVVYTDQAISLVNSSTLLVTSTHYVFLILFVIWSNCIKAHVISLLIM